MGIERAGLSIGLCGATEIQSIELLTWLEGQFIRSASAADLFDRGFEASRHQGWGILVNIQLELNGGARVLTLSPQPRCLDASNPRIKEVGGRFVSL